MAEVEKHNSKESCWVVLHGRVLDVTTFLKDHPGGELAILTFAGKDATHEFDMIHPPDVISKYAPSSIIGVLGDGSGAATNMQGGPAPSGGKKGKDWGRKETNVQKRMDGHGKIGGFLGALSYMVFSFMREIVLTIFPQKSIRLQPASTSRVALTRSAMFLFVFIIIHAVGNLHVFLGPDDFNGYGYFYVRLYWTGFGLQANIVEEYVLLAALMHIIVAIKRTSEVNLKSTLGSGRLNLAISGVTLLTFMTVHLFQFRFGVTQSFTLCPPPYLVNIWGIVHLTGFNLFWVDVGLDDTKCKQGLTAVRDIYRLEYDVFKSLGWCVFYISAVIVFCCHTCLGWVKVVGSPSLGIPQRHQIKASHMGFIITAFVALIYISFPVYCHLTQMSLGHYCEQHPDWSMCKQ
eukprot:NODE_7664_length_1559_cov_80.076117.p1 GENE.NODE_7664_length_1559_cov_80.076117~~NODE_7664_length_1559_cov_80.076117.p1  ORF type:complete len:418 (+),score=103.72 NODE_7664_length_1559_cov_80.076117:45-1256(+)